MNATLRPTRLGLLLLALAGAAATARGRVLDLGVEPALLRVVGAFPQDHIGSPPPGRYSLRET